MTRIISKETDINVPYGRLCGIGNDSNGDELYDFFFYLTEADNNKFQSISREDVIEIEFPCCIYRGTLTRIDVAQLEKMGDFKYKIYFTIKSLNI